MKRSLAILLALFMLFALGCASGKNKRTAASSDPFSTSGSGNTAVSSYRPIRKPYLYSPENLCPSTGAGSFAYIWVLDANGRVTECHSWNKIYEYSYNDKGYPVTQVLRSLVMTYRDTGDNLMGQFTYQYQYTDSGKPLKVVRTYSGHDGADLNSGDIDTFTYQYENDKVTAVDDVRTRNGSRINASHYTVSYNAEGTMSAIRWSHENIPGFIYYILFVYENGILTEARCGYRELPDTSETYTQTTVYYENNEPVRVTSGNDSVTFQYDASGSLVRINDQTFNLPEVDQNGHVIGN